MISPSTVRGRAVIAAVVMFFHLCPAYSAAGAPAVVSARFVASPPALDGRLDDPCWRSAPFVAFSSAEEKRPARTEFALARDDWGVYLAVRCFTPNPEKAVAECRTFDGLFAFNFKDDEIAVFFDTDRDRASYYWFKVNPAGVRTDLFCNCDPDRSWNGAWKAATGKEAGAWTAELFFPFAGFSRGRLAGAWGFNIARRQNLGGGKIVAAVWTGHSRRPWTYGVLEGVEPRRAPFRYDVSEITLGHVGKDGTAPLRARVRNKTGRDVALEPRFEIVRPSAAVFIPPAGPREFVDGARVRIKNGGAAEISAPVRVGGDEVLIVTVEARDEAGRLVLRSPDRLVRPARLIEGRGPEFNYYTDEATANIRVALRCPRATKAAYVSVNYRGRELARRAVSGPNARTLLSIDVKDMPFGRNRITVRLAAAGGTLGEREYEIVKLPPRRGGSRVRIRRWSRSFEVNGKPFVPVGTSPLCSRGVKFAGSMMADFARNGFNTIFLWGGFLRRPGPGKPELAELDLETFVRLLDAAEKNGLMVVAYLGSPLLNNPKHPWRKGPGWSDDDRIEIVKKVVEKARGHRALLMYEIYDEPEFIVTRAWLERAYAAVKETDPYHPVSINFCRGTRSALSYGRATDTVGIDYYPVCKGPVSTLGPLIDELRYMSDWKPIKNWIQTIKIAGDRAPTPAEVEAMTYITAARGSAAFFYFLAKGAGGAQWRAQGNCARELRLLADAICADRKRALEVTPPGSGVYASLRESAGQYRIIAVNETDSPAAVEIVLPHDVAAQRVKVLFEGREAEYSEGKIRDRFEPLQRHVYEIAVKGAK